MPHLPALGFPPNSAFSSRDLIKLPDIVPSNLIVNLGRIIMSGLFAAASSPITRGPGTAQLAPVSVSQVSSGAILPAD